MKLDAIPTMLSMIPSVFAGVTLDDLQKVKEIARQAYPSVAQISTETLARWMEHGSKPYLLIDVRSPAEFAVSHLKGALNLQSADEIERTLGGGCAEEPILYCSVGFRSTRLARILMDRGYANVSNLEGSIFQWSNEGRPVYQGNVSAKVVHPYSKRWAGLLKQGLASES